VVRPTVLTRNFMLKVFSLAVSVLIFLFVSVESATPVHVEFPLEFRMGDDMMLTGDTPERLHTTLQGPWANFRSFGIMEVEPVVVDLTSAEPGELRKSIEFDQIRPPAGMSVVGVRPAEIVLNLERRVERLVPVEADIMDRPAFGYDILAVHIDPKEVRVVGPRSKVATLDFISTRPLNVNGQTEGTTLEADLRPPSAGVRLLERRVTVVIEIAEEFVTRPFANVKVALDNAPRGTKVSPSAVTVSLKGPRRLVDSMEAKNLEVFVDIQGEVEDGLRSFEKVVAVRNAPDRTVLVTPIPNVVVQVPKQRRRKR
jgi:YbbR domain-containing protein